MTTAAHQRVSALLDLTIPSAEWAQREAIRLGIIMNTHTALPCPGERVDPARGRKSPGPSYFVPASFNRGE